MKVSVHLISQSKPIEHENIINAYIKVVCIAYY